MIEREKNCLPDVKFELVEEKLLVKKTANEIEKEVNLLVVPDYTDEIL